MKSFTAVLVLAATPLAASIWPDQAGQFKRTSSAPVRPADPPLFEEYGFDQAERAVYEGAGGKYTATAWRFEDPTGAFAAYQFLRPEGSGATELVSTGASLPGAGLIMAYGNYVLQWEGRTPDEAELRYFFEQLPRLDRSSLPALPDFFPSRGRIPNSERYLLGPVSLERFEPRIPPSAAAFRYGAEGQFGRFRLGSGEMPLTIFNYPTPQIARERQAEMQKLPGAFVKRAGPLVAVMFSPPDPDAAERLLATVRYSATVTWSESTAEKTELRRFGEFILSVFIFIGLLVLFALVSGFAVGSFRRLLSARFGRKSADEPLVMLDLGDK